MKRRQVWIAIIQRNDQTEVYLVIGSVIQKTATLGVIIQRPAHRMYYTTLLVQSLVNFPDFLDSDAVMLRVGSGPQSEFFYQLLAEVAVTALRENRVLAEQFVTRLIGGFALSILADAHIAGGDSPYPALFVIQNLGRRKSRKNIHTELLRLFPQPLAQPAQADDVVTLVMHRRRYEKSRHPERFSLAGHIENKVAGDRRPDRCSLLPPVRKQLVEPARFEYVAGEDMRADLRAFFDHDH